LINPQFSKVLILKVAFKLLSFTIMLNTNSLQVKEEGHHLVVAKTCLTNINEKVYKGWASEPPPELVTNPLQFS